MVDFWEDYTCHYVTVTDAFDHCHYWIIRHFLIKCHRMRCSYLMTLVISLTMITCFPLTCNKLIYKLTIGPQNHLIFSHCLFRLHELVSEHFCCLWISLIIRIRRSSVQLNLLARRTTFFQDLLTCSFILITMLTITTAPGMFLNKVSYNTALLFVLFPFILVKPTPNIVVILEQLALKISCRTRIRCLSSWSPKP